MTGRERTGREGKREEERKRGKMRSQRDKDRDRDRDSHEDNLNTVPSAPLSAHKNPNPNTNTNSLSVRNRIRHKKSRIVRYIHLLEFIIYFDIFFIIYSQYHLLFHQKNIHLNHLIHDKSCHIVATSGTYSKLLKTVNFNYTLCFFKKLSSN
jgi:hypothetical protein